MKLTKEVDGCLQRGLAALGLRDAVVEAPHFVDDAVAFRTNLFGRRVDANLGELDAQPNLVLLRQGLRHARVADESKTQRALQGRRLAGNGAIERIYAEASALEGDTQLIERLRPERGDGKDRVSMRSRDTDFPQRLLAFELSDLDGSIVALCRAYGFRKCEHLTMQHARGEGARDAEDHDRPADEVTVRKPDACTVVGRRRQRPAGFRRRHLSTHLWPRGSFPLHRRCSSGRCERCRVPGPPGTTARLSDPAPSTTARSVSRLSPRSPCHLAGRRETDGPPRCARLRKISRGHRFDLGFLW